MVSLVLEVCCCMWLGSCLVGDVVSRYDARRRRLLEEEWQAQERIAARINASLAARIAVTVQHAAPVAVAVAVKQPSVPPTTTHGQNEEEQVHHPLLRGGSNEQEE